MSVRELDDPNLFARVQEQNLLRQYDLLTNCIDIGAAKGVEAFDKYTLWSLNAAAVANIAQFGGRFRREPILVGDYIPPHFDAVPSLVDRMLSIVHENWGGSSPVTLLPAYVLWRLNWIHPFVEGNGRTARAACYYLLCLGHGGVLPGRKAIPERIRENRVPYYAALKTADRHWEDGHLNIDELALYLEGLVRDQIKDLDAT
ncbi:MAG: Fic family protein [Nannocystaceae bacterium]|nr:Fic family protein [Nannocystaceae bacterium]